MHTAFPRIQKQQQEEMENSSRTMERAWTGVHRETETKTESRTEQPTKSIILYPLCSIVNCFWLFTCHRLMQLHSISVMIPSRMLPRTIFTQILFLCSFRCPTTKTEKYFRVISHAQCGTIPFATVYMMCVSAMYSTAAVALKGTI